MLCYVTNQTLENLSALSSDRKKKMLFLHTWNDLSLCQHVGDTILLLQIYFSIIVWIGEKLSAMCKLFLNHTQLPIAANNWLKVSPSNLKRHMLTQANNCITYLKDVQSFVSNNQQVATLQEVQLNSVGKWSLFEKKMYLFWLELKKKAKTRLICHYCRCSVSHFSVRSRPGSSHLVWKH